MRQIHKFIFRGPSFQFKASAAQDQLASEQANFYQNLTQDYATQFANQSAVLSSLTSEFEPILTAGPSQTGYSPAELSALDVGSDNAITGSYDQAQIALNNQIAARGGTGATALPSGVNEQLTSALLTGAAQQKATTKNQIQQADYATGLQNFDTAAQVLGGVAAQYNPIGYAGASTNAGESAFNEATTIQNENTAWEGELGGILGGVAGAALGGPLGGDIGSHL